MCFDTSAVLTFGIAIPREVDVGSLLDMKDAEVDEFFEKEHGELETGYLSSYDERGVYVALKETTISVHQFDPEPFTQNVVLDQISPERFWNAVGPKLEKRFKRAGMSPSWILCIVRS